MITVICGTNRANSNTLKFAQHYVDVLRSKTNEGVELLELDKLGSEWYNAAMYSEANIGDTVKEVQDALMIPSSKIVFVSPEYNGSIPGALKLFLDALSIRKAKETFSMKKALLVGVAMGRAGNLRGLEHLTGMLNHLGLVVHPNKLPISACHTLVDDAGKVNNEGTLKVIDAHVDSFLQF